MNGSTHKGFVERIVCLANSRRPGGHCIAGKRKSDQTWIRPISNRPDHAIMDIDMKYQDSKTAQLLDIIELPCIRKMPIGHQAENVLIDSRLRWKKIGRASWSDVTALVDDDADLWANGDSSYYGNNNRVPENLIDHSAGSLRLIELNKITLHVGPKAPDFGNKKTVVRANFDYKDQKYQLDLTDPEFELVCRNKGDGEYLLEHVIACISLAQLYKGYAYKLVASIITPQRARV